MKTNNFFEDLEKYFETTPREKVLQDWAKSEKLDEVGPTVEEFLTHTSKDPVIEQLCCQFCGTEDGNHGLTDDGEVCPLDRTA